MLCSVPGVCGHHAANSAHVNITLRHRTANTWRKDERIAGGVKAKSAGSQEVEECRGKSGGEGRQFRRRGLQLHNARMSVLTPREENTSTHILNSPALPCGGSCIPASCCATRYVRTGHHLQQPSLRTSKLCRMRRAKGCNQRSRDAVR